MQPPWPCPTDTAPPAPRQHDSRLWGEVGVGCGQFSPPSGKHLGKECPAHLRVAGWQAGAWRDERLALNNLNGVCNSETLEGPVPLQLLFSCDGCRPLRLVSLFLSILSKSIACSHSPLLTNSCDAWSAFTVRTQAGFLCPRPLGPGFAPVLPGDSGRPFPDSVKGSSPATFSSPAGVSQSWLRFGAPVCT